MAAIALRTSGDISLDIVDFPTVQLTLAAAEALVPGDVVAIDTAGKWTKTNANGASIANFRNIYGVVVRKAAAGETVTAVRKGRLDGLNLDGLAYNAPVYVADAGGLADAAGTVATVNAGRVIPGRANLPSGNADKLLEVDFQSVAVS